MLYFLVHSCDVYKVIRRKNAIFILTGITLLLSLVKCLPVVVYVSHFEFFIVEREPGHTAAMWELRIPVDLFYHLIVLPFVKYDS